jgi:CHAD domain-containing protein
MIRFREYGAQVIRERLVQMLVHAPGVRLADDIEALHDMRVASRRLRAALSMFAPSFHDADFKRFEQEVKAVTDSLGTARDVDVMIETLEALEAELPEGERAGMEHFVAERKAERVRLQKGVVRALDRLEKQDLLARFDAIVARGAARAAQATVSAGTAPTQPGTGG